MQHKKTGQSEKTIPWADKVFEAPADAGGELTAWWAKQHILCSWDEVTEAASEFNEIVEYTVRVAGKAPRMKVTGRSRGGQEGDPRAMHSKMAAGLLRLGRVQALPVSEAMAAEVDSIEDEKRQFGNDELWLKRLRLEALLRGAIPPEDQEGVQTAMGTGAERLWVAACPDVLGEYDSFHRSPEVDFGDERGVDEERGEDDVRFEAHAPRDAT